MSLKIKQKQNKKNPCVYIHLFEKNWTKTEKVVEMTYNIWILETIKSFK